MVKAKKIEEVRAWLAAGLLLLLSNPMWLWGMNQLIMTFWGLLFFTISFRKILLSKTSLWLIIAFCLQISFLWVAIVTKDTNINGYLQLFITFFVFATIFLCDKKYWKTIIDKLIIILAILLIPALIEHILMSFIGLDFPYHYITECPSNPDRDYYVYNFNAYLVMSLDIGRVRFFAFYDEPGVLGNIMMVLLFIQRFNLKKWYNIVFLVSGLLSFSLTFYFAVIGYFLVVGGIRTKISFIVVGVVLVALFYDSPVVEELLFSRMVIEDGQLSGYNREGVNFDSWFSNRSVNEYLFSGYDGKIEYAASWKWALVRWGIIPCFLYLFSILSSAIRTRITRHDLFLVLIIMVVIFIQRPFFMNYLYAFLIVIPHLYLSAESDMSKQESLQKAIKPIGV